MNRCKQFLSLGILALMVLSFSGCETTKVEYDVSGYVRAVMDSTYRNENDDYIEFTLATTPEAEENNNTTCTNAAVRFFTKHGVNPSEAQTIALAKVFQAQYAKCAYTVEEKSTTTDGYQVAVRFTPDTTFVGIDSRIDALKTAAGDQVYTVGASYIDSIITLCRELATTPATGDEKTKLFDIRLSDTGELSLNIKLFAEIDHEMLPVE